LPLSSENLDGDVANKIESAFTELHKLDVVHGDVKAANILVAADTSVWIIDFEDAQIVSGRMAKVLIEAEDQEVKRLLGKIQRGEQYC